MSFGAFAAGFAEGFVDQTLADRDRRLRQEEELVKLGFANSMRQHEERTQREQAHREMYSQATELARQLNLVGEEALIFNQLNLRGGNVDKVISDIQSGTIRPISSAEQVRPATDSPEAIDQQMIQSGMVDMPPAEQEQEGGFWDNLLALGQGRDRRVQEGVTGMMEAAGIDPSASGFVPPTARSQLVMGGDTSNLIPLQDITDVATFERAVAIAQNVDNLPQSYLSGLSSIRETLFQQQDLNELSSFIDGAKTENEFVISLARAQEEGASERTVQSIQSILSAVRSYGFEPPTTQGEWLRQRSIASARGDTDKLNFLNQLTGVFSRTTQFQLLAVDGQAVNAIPEFVDGEIVYRNVQTGEIIEGRVTVLPDEAREDRRNLIRDLSRQAEAVQQQQQLVIGLADSALDLSDLLAANPTAATSVARGFSGLVQAGRELETIAGVAGSLLQNSGDEGVSEQQLSAELRRQGLLRGDETLESLANSFVVEDLIGASGAQLEQAARAYQAQLIILAMRAGAAEGQSGRALTNSMFERLSQFIKISRTPRQLDQNMSTYLGTLYRDLELLERGLTTDNIQVRNYISEYGVNPIQFMTAGELISESDRLREAAARFNLPVDIAQPEATSAPTPEPTTQVQPEATTQQTPPAPQERNTRLVTITQSMADRNPALGALVGQDVLFEELPSGQWSLVGPQ